MPSVERFTLTTTCIDCEVAGAYGIMFNVVPNRAIVVENFHVEHFGLSNQFEFHVYTKAGSWAEAPTNQGSWTEIGHVTLASNANPVMLPSSSIDPVTIYAGQTQSFYIASVGVLIKVLKESEGTSQEVDDLSLFTGKKIGNTRFAAGDYGDYR